MKTSNVKFTELNLDNTIVDALKKNKIEAATEIQEKAIPLAIDGKDVIGRSKTGSGKTLAFSIPIVQELMSKPGRGIKAMVLVPTRELAKQVEDEVKMMKTQLKTCSIYGGVEYEPQFKALEKADIVVGTPGRVIDHIKRGTMDLTNLEFFVLDEADRMLDMGFIQDIKTILEYTPQYKQNFFFSATMPREARELAESFMTEPEVVGTEEVFVSNDLLEEWYVDCEATRKAEMLAEIIRIQEPERALVFVNSRLFTDKVAEFLVKKGYDAESLHGGHAQNKRERIVKQFEKGNVHILVATDVAARGLDIDDITHVYNYEVPKETATYTHRIGRTARAGKKGIAVTLLDREEHRDFKRIEGDSLRNLEKLRVDFNPKKTYFLPRRNGNGPRNGRGGNNFRRGRGNGPQRGRGGPRKHSGKGPRKKFHGKRQHAGRKPSSGKKPFMPKH